MKAAVLLIAIIGLAAFLRMYRLDTFPPGLYPDEAANTTDAIRAANTGHYLAFYSNNNGREGLFMNLIALSFKAFGTNIVTLRMVSATVGTLTVVAMYFLGKSMFGRKAGLIASFLVAVSYWHLNFSRISFRAIQVPLILAASFTFLVFAYKKAAQFISEHQKPDLSIIRASQALFVLAGLVFGIGFHTYIAFRVAPAVVFVFFFLIFLAHPKTRFTVKHLIAIPLLLFMLGTVVTASPMIYHFVKHPEHLNARQNDNSISALDPQNNHGDILGTLLKTFTQTFGQFLYRGDLNWRHNLPPNPELSPFVAIMFLLGLCLALTFLFLGLKHIWTAKDKKADFSRVQNNIVFYGTLLAWLVIMLSPAYLTVEGLPHALRSIGSLPAVFLLSTMPIVFILNAKLPRQNTKDPVLNTLGTLFFRLKSGIIFLSLAVTALQTYMNYFHIWGPSPQAASAFERRLVNIGNYLAQSDPEKTKYVVVNYRAKFTDLGFPVSLETIHFFTYQKARNVVYLLPEQISGISPLGDFEVVVQRRDDALIARLKENLPVVEQEISMTPSIIDTSFITLQKKTN